MSTYKITIQATISVQAEHYNDIKLTDELGRIGKVEILEIKNVTKGE